MTSDLPQVAGSMQVEEQQCATPPNNAIRENKREKSFPFCLYLVLPLVHLLGIFEEHFMKVLRVLLMKSRTIAQVGFDGAH
jgi:hypothetical protein